VLIAWNDFREITDPTNGSDIYLTRMTLGGSLAPGWPSQGLLVTPVGDRQLLETYLQSLVPDGTGGALVAWRDTRGNAAPNLDDVYAVRVTATGALAPHWPSGGAPVCIAPDVQYGVLAAGDGAGGMIVTWADSRPGYPAFAYAQRIDRFGALGDASPHLTSVRDLGGDQGGSVRLTWNASVLDADPGYDVGAYWIWRQTPSAIAARAVRDGGRWLGEGVDRPGRPADGPDRAGVSTEGGGVAIDPGTSVPRGSSPSRLFRHAPDAAASYAWEFVASQPANASPQYSFVAGTTRDSMAQSNPYTAFMVEARQSFGFAYWDSPADSGYSVDNLAPATPSPFGGVWNNGVAMLDWGVNHEPDFAIYRLYRDGDPGFVPGPSFLVAETQAPHYQDPAAARYAYKLVAVDVHGNGSAPAVWIPLGGVAVPPAALPGEVAFGAVSPNPARSVVVFQIDLPRPARVALTVFDAGGRRVARVGDADQGAGRLSLRWVPRDASGHGLRPGLYLVVLEAEGRRFERRFVIVR
jgi:hypothetical protein